MTVIDIGSAKAAASPHGAPILHHTDHVWAVLLRQLPRFVPNLQPRARPNNTVALRGPRHAWPRRRCSSSQLRGKRRYFRKALRRPVACRLPRIKKDQRAGLEALDKLQSLRDNRHDLGVALLRSHHHHHRRVCGSHSYTALSRYDSQDLGSLTNFAPGPARASSRGAPRFPRPVRSS